jgi:hypothetical protein
VLFLEIEEHEMGHEVETPKYQGLQKYPGILATIITLAIGATFLGALYQGAQHGAHDGHEEASHEEGH